ncbi:MAG: ferredoxin oxidoreductase [Desulfotomaculaceae bacterium]|nr:ferredoxin oxidoreductase [Desulfotomaculaceae bacterium]
MSEKPIQGERRAFLTGNEVVAWAAVASEAEIMFGYPITPQNEIMHYWTRMAPKFNKRFLQTEDEISAGFTTNGGVLAGLKAFTATSGPGNTLMQEPISMAEMMRLPIVTIVQQRGGPSSATVIYSQQEVNLTTHGGNGEGLRIVYSTATHQELFDYTIKAFNTAWKYRFPTFVLGDGYQAKMREPLTIYDPEVRGIEMVPAYKFVGKPGKPGVDRPPTQLRNIFNMEEELFEELGEQFADFEKISPQIAECEQFGCENAEIVVTAHGIVARAAKSAVKDLRERGLKVGYFRPITLRPLPVKELRDTFSRAQKVLVAESANGQFDQLLKYAAYGITTEMVPLFKPGVGINSEDIYDKVMTMLAS